MTREQVLDRILDPTGTPLNKADQLEFECWLQQEPELRSMFEQQQALFQTMDLWESEEPSASFDQGVYARIQLDAESQPFWRRFLFASWKPALAAGIAAAALLIGVYRSPEAPPQEIAVKAAPDAAYYEEIERALDDMEMLVDFDAFPELPAPGRS